MTDSIQALAAHVHATRFEDLPPAAVTAAKTFIQDCLGVGLAGSAGPFVSELIRAETDAGGAAQARVWVSGTALPARSAAMINAYQIHNAEFDCVHEQAVIHAMTVPLACILAQAERSGTVSGRDLLLAATLGVDVACHIGVAARGRMRFFRPGTGGAFGAVAALGKLMGFSTDRLVDAFGVLLGQLGGTMQAHEEGSALLGMQIGFNARNAMLAVDLAALGIGGPRAVLDGENAFFALFEGGNYDMAPSLAALGKVWRVAELAHKPFPSGRATHGVMDAALALQREHGFAAGDVQRVAARVPPLTHQLVGRPPQADMSVNYARLCASWTTARALLRDGLGVTDFLPEALNDPETLDLARRIDIAIDDNPDLNALSPVEVDVTLRDGGTLSQRVEIVYGNPARPLSRAAHLEKFERNRQAAAAPISKAKGDRLIALVDDLEAVTNAADLVDLMLPDR